MINNDNFIRGRSTTTMTTDCVSTMCVWCLSFDILVFFSLNHNIQPTIIIIIDNRLIDGTNFDWSIDCVPVFFTSSSSFFFVLNFSFLGCREWQNFFSSCCISAKLWDNNDDMNKLEANLICYLSIYLLNNKFQQIVSGIFFRYLSFCFFCF